MHYTQEAAEAILQMAETCLKSNDPSPLRLRKLWWTLLYTRARALSLDLRTLTQDKIFAGPFKDMALTQEAIHAYLSPIVLGCYEHELHPVFEQVVATDYAHILNIGCSVGYYAVGLARRMPQMTIDAFDIDPEARRKCAEMARANGVEDRVRISGEFYGNDFARYANEKTLVLMDIEGAERELLDPTLYPTLQSMDIIVELHDLLDPGISKNIAARFEPTHTIEIIKNRNFLPDVSGLLSDSTTLSPYDHLLLGWEGRDGATPWGVFRPKAK